MYCLTKMTQHYDRAPGAVALKQNWLGRIPGISRSVACGREGTGHSSCLLSSEVGTITASVHVERRSLGLICASLPKLLWSGDPRSQNACPYGPAASKKCTAPHFHCSPWQL